MDNFNSLKVALQKFKQFPKVLATLDEAEEKPLNRDNWCVVV